MSTKPIIYISNPELVVLASLMSIKNNEICIFWRKRR